MKEKLYSSAPLPFMGQKRRFISHFREALRSFDDATTFVDLFGGSGLLSHTVKRVRPDARVIYNDYDDYHLRIANVTRTNALLADIRVLITGVADNAKLPSGMRDAILSRVAEEEQSGFVDYITLSSSLLFSMNYANDFGQLSRATMYSRVHSSGYDCCGYLTGLDVVKYDYKELFEMFKDQPAVVFIIDPPYLSTEVGTYKNDWKLADYLDVLRTLHDVSYFYFTSNKSSIIELVEWLQKAHHVQSPFAGANRKEITNTPTLNSKFTDIMVWKNGKSK